MQSGSHPDVGRAIERFPEAWQADDDTLRGTGARLRSPGLRGRIGAHCAGVEAVYRLRDLTRLGRPTPVVGAASSLEGGIDPGVIAR